MPKIESTLIGSCIILVASSHTRRSLQSWQGQEAVERQNVAKKKQFKRLDHINCVKDR
jgi:hypothetical protein